VHLQGNIFVANHNGLSSGSYRYLPFALFMGFIGIDEFARFLAGQGLFKLEATTLYYLYPIKTLVTGYLLYLFKEHYKELRLRDLTNIPATLTAFGIGLLVFALWIRMDWTFGTNAAPQGFNPLLLQGQTTRISMTFFRIAGAVLVVPLMEEIFWRSFLIRYAIERDFSKVPIGTFTPASFFITVVLFGLEHNYILAGIMAGALYNILLYRTRSLAQCVLSHAVTNLALAIYILYTGKWEFW
jgi:CAAX prenyl protease-like protein